MRSLDEHARVVLDLIASSRWNSPTEPVPLESAQGRVLAVTHKALTATPPFTNSAMDGFAVRSADLETAGETPVVLQVVDAAIAGHPARSAVLPGTTVRIMTGAAVPEGADAVVAQERVKYDDATARFAEPVTVGSHIREWGEDMRAGEPVLVAGERLGPRHLAAAASVGLSKLTGVKRPRVGYLVTGDELVAPGTALGPGQIHDSNSSYLRAAISALGAEPVDLTGGAGMGDQASAVARAVQQADVDLVVTTGGASVGEHDPAKAALAPLGVEFVNVAMQPGKPQGAGLVGGVPVLCLPGNPVAVAVSVEVFVAPAVRAMLGVAEPAWTLARAGAAWDCPRGREQVMPIAFTGDAVVPATRAGSGSHMVANLARAHGLARVAAQVDRVEIGDTVSVRRFTT
jgi:molybdenum cofactor synthesis domain-containing protein